MPDDTPHTDKINSRLKDLAADYKTLTQGEREHEIDALRKAINQISNIPTRDIYIKKVESRLAKITAEE